MQIVLAANISYAKIFDSWLAKGFTQTLEWRVPFLSHVLNIFCIFPSWLTMAPLSSRSQRNLYQLYDSLLSVFSIWGNPSNGQSPARKGKPSESFSLPPSCVATPPACKWIPGSGSHRAHSAGCSPNKGLNCGKLLGPLFVFPFCTEVLRIHGKPEHSSDSL